MASSDCHCDPQKIFLQSQFSNKMMIPIVVEYDERRHGLHNRVGFQAEPLKCAQVAELSPAAWPRSCPPRLTGSFSFLIQHHLPFPRISS